MVAETVGEASIIPETDGREMANKVWTEHAEPLSADDARAGWRGYLAQWYRNAPLEHRTLVAGGLAMLAAIR